MSYEKKCIVFNVGAYSTIVGFSDNELPTCVLPSTYMQNKLNPQEYIFDRYEMLQIASPTNHTWPKDDYEVFTLVANNGLPYNWEGLERQWDYIFKAKLKCDPSDYPVVIILPMISKTTQLRVIMERYMTLMFQKFKIPIIQFVLEPLATTLSMGKKNALVIDIGYTGCKVTPVIDGVVVKNGIMKNKFGGAFLDYSINQFLNDKVKTLSEDDMIVDDNDNDKSPIDNWWESNTLIKEFKMSMLQVCDKDLNELERYYQEQEQMYLKQQEQMKQLGGTGIVTGAMPAFNSNVVNMTNNPLVQTKTYLHKHLNKTFNLNQREIYQLTEYLFKPNLFSSEFNKDDGLSEIISKSIKKTAATISSSGQKGDKNDTSTTTTITSNTIQQASQTNSSGSGTNNGSNVIRTVGASIIIPPKLVTNNQQNGIKNINFMDDMTFTGHGLDAKLESSSSSGGGQSMMMTAEHIYSSLLTNVIITGSTSLIYGMEQRIIQELSIRFPQYKLITFANQYMIDRELQNWNNGCTMANLPTWELGRWYSQEEWETTQNPIQDTMTAATASETK